MRRLGIFITTVTALVILLAAPASARSPHEVDAAAVTPPLNPNLAPWACWEAGSGIICEGSVEESYANEDFGLRCGDQVIYITGTFSDRATRWHTADGRATKTYGNQTWSETWTLSPDGSGPVIDARSRSIRHYTYHVPGNPQERQLVETASITATAPDGGLIFRDAGRIVYEVGAENDFQNPAEIRGPHDTWTDWDAALARVCEVLEA